MQDYAVIESGSKQYQVSTGDHIDIEYMDHEGTSLLFEKILLTKTNGKVSIGNPLVSHAIVTAEVIGEVKGPKVIAYKYKKRKNYRRKVGHRQNYLRVKITGIQG